MNVTQETVVETYSFRLEDLSPATRRPGISAFMRIKNGADFLEATIRSHIDHFDEIVAVYNQCTDATPDILGRLAQEFGSRLRVLHYLPRVYPPGSKGHASEPPNSPHSFVNMSNFAITRTRHTVTIKLDDDHLAMPDRLAAIVAAIRSDNAFRQMTCFSGLNLVRNAAGQIGIFASEPFSGSGDIGFFPVTRYTYFTHDPRFERVHSGDLRRRFGGFAYWHLKYLKRGGGFANYDLEANPDSRFARKQAAFPADPPLVDLAALPALMSLGEHVAVAARAVGLPLPEKTALRTDRWIEAERMARTTALPPVPVIAPLPG